jgi:hypothetical protein
LGPTFEFDSEELSLIVIISPKAFQVPGQVASPVKNLRLQQIFKINAHGANFSGSNCPFISLRIRRPGSKWGLGAFWGRKAPHKG